MTLDEEFGADRLELPCGTETLIVGQMPNGRVLIGIATKSLRGGYLTVPYATSHMYRDAALLRDYLDEILKDKP